ncbi:hypothetical protein MnTg02_00351 [bacterium MnTg02]|nr:hypothetical protein MnTg02_00351 [bacterium MnTg02]
MTKALQNKIDLVPQQRNAFGRTRIGAGGKQSNNPQLSPDRTVLIVEFNADIIHMHTPVHIGADIRLGDDKRRGREKELPDFRCPVQHLMAAAQYMNVRISQNT